MNKLTLVNTTFSLVKLYLYSKHGQGCSQPWTTENVQSFSTQLSCIKKMSVQAVYIDP